jgi:putative tricarboxylic transport membrane protein
MSSENGAGDSRPPAEAIRLGPFKDAGGLAIALVMLVFAAMIAWDASSYPSRAGYGNFGPAIFPYIVGAGIAVLALLTGVLAFKGWFPEREEMNFAPFLWVAGAVVAEIAVLGSGFGFIPASGLLFGFAARGMGKRPLWLTVLVGVGISLLLYILFRHGLGLSLPAGPIERVVDGILR